MYCDSAPNVIYITRRYLYSKNTLFCSYLFIFLPYVVCCSGYIVKKMIEAQERSMSAGQSGQSGQY